MPHYYFHLTVGAERYPDHLGLEFPNFEAAYLDAFQAAQEMWSELLKERQDPLTHTFEISDSEGQLLLKLPFAEVLEQARKPSPPPSHTFKDTVKLMQKTKTLIEALNSETLRAQETLRAVAQTIHRA